MKAVALPPRLSGESPLYGAYFGQAHEWPLAMIANRSLPPEQTVFVCRWRMPAPWKDLEHVLPVRHEAVTAWERGDLSVLRTLVDEVVESQLRMLSLMTQS